MRIQFFTDPIETKSNGRSLWLRGLCLIVCLTFFFNSVLLPSNTSADTGSEFLITKTVDKSTVYPGEPFVYTIQYSNPDIHNDAVNATVTDILPTNIEYISAEGSTQIQSIEKTGSPGSETVIFHFKNPLPAGSSGVLHITAKFPSGTTLGGDANAAVNSATIVSDNKPAAVSDTVTVTPQVKAPDWSISKTKIIPSSTPAVGNPVTYRIDVTGNSVIGGLNMTNLVITDTIPAGATYVSSSDSGVYDPDSGIVTFPALGTLGVGQRVSRTVTLLYSDPAFTVASTVINGAAAVATPLGDSTQIAIQTTATHGFAAPLFAIGDFIKTARQINDRYSIGQEAVFYLNGISNAGNIPFDQIMVEDDIPSVISLNSISAGSYNQNVNIKIYFQTDIQMSYVLWDSLDNPSNNLLSVADLRSSLKIGAGEIVTKVRWVITSADSLQPGFSIGSPIVMRATVNAPTGNDITNTANLTASRGVETLTDSSSKIIYVIDAMPWLMPAKTVRKTGIGSFAGTVTANMQDSVEFRLRIQNNPFATGAYIDPVAVDVLPPELENVTFDRYEKSSGSIAITLNEPLAAIVDGKWVFRLTGTLLPGEYVDIFYTAKVKDQTTVGLYNNDFYISTLDNATPYQNDAGQQLADGGDLDGDTVLTDRFIKSTASFFVKFSGSLNSYKLMKGALDNVWTKYPAYGSTLPGGISDYQVAISNDGSNGPISNIVIIDELPAVGDTSVLGSAARLSAWQPYLVNNIIIHYYDALGAEKAFPAEAAVTTYYSTNRNVSTAELFNSVSGTPDASWTTVLPNDITTVLSLKFKFANFQIEKGEKIIIEWAMRAPLAAPLGLIAWNSFAYGATYTDYVNSAVTNTSFLPSEPIKVGYLVQDPAAHPYNIGDRVWEDMNKNGVQDADEPGINGILVNLYDSGDHLISYTRSGKNQTGDDGYFLFPDVPVGNYYLQFVYPTSYQVTNYQTPGNTALDSDINESLETTYTDLDIVKKAIKTSVFNIAADNLTIDAGLYHYAELGNLVWNDKDADGIQDAGEPGVSGVRVDLLDGAGSPVLHTTTDASGFYLFSNLDPGTYRVKFTNPGGQYAFSPADGGANDAADSDGTAAGDGSSATTGVITLISGQSDLTVDQGIYLGRIGDFVFHDFNANGIREGGDTGIGGVTVKLYAAGGTTLLLTTTTDSNGYYLFDDLVPADYIVQVVLPGTYSRFTLQNQGADDANDSDIDRITGKSSLITINAGEREMTIDAGLYKYASLGNLVWNDRDADGIQDGGEPGIVGAEVYLLDGLGAPVLDGLGDPVMTVTDASGNYLFSNLDLGSYQVKFINPGGDYGISPSNAGGSDANDSDGIAAGDSQSTTTGYYTLLSGDNNATVDQGFYLGRIGDFVFDDKDADGIRDIEDTGISGVTVKLYAADGTTLLQTTTSNPSGLYYFEDIFAGSYIVEVTKPAAYNRITQQNQGGDDAADSDVDRTTGRTGLIVMDIGERDLTVDAGLYKYANLGNYVWNDRDADGVQDNGEPVIAGVTVHLLNPDGSQATDDNGTPVAPTVTDANGLYSFGTLTPGSYKVKFINPGGNYGISPANAGGNDAADSDGIAAGDSFSTTTGSYTLISGQNDSSVDQGFYLGRIGDLVFHDLNANGIKESGESGIGSVTVKLYAADGTTLLKSTATNGSGLYYFEDIFSGSYIVEFTKPGTYDRITLQNQGANDALDSDADRSTGRTGLIVMDTGERDLTVDAGLYKYASIGDKTWFDLDADGIQDDGEAALPGVTVYLLNNDGSQAVNDSGTLVAPVQTNSSGIYGFGTLTPGVYKLQFDLPTAEYQHSPVNTTSALIDSDAIVATGLTVSTTLTSGESDISWDAGFYKALIGDFVFEDKNANGIQDAGEPGIANVTVQLWLSDGRGGWTYNAQTTTDANGLYAFTQLDSGTYQVRFTSPGAAWVISPANQGADDSKDSDQDASGFTGNIDMAVGETDRTNDAGFYRLASVGDRIWNDLDGDGIQDGGEPGFAGVEVHLTGPYGTDLYATTDANGNYTFGSLIPGSYTVTVNTSTLPAGYYQSYEQDGSKNSSTVAVLISNDNRTDIDFGYYIMPSIGDRVFADTNANGIQDVGEIGIAGVSVQLLNTSNTVLNTTLTDASGNYLFSNLTVGSYKIRVITPASYLISPINVGADDSADSDLLADGRTAAYMLIGGTNERTADGGLYLPASIGNKVWLDSNCDGIQNGTENGVSNVEVRLFNSIGGLLATDYTDVNGDYLFASLTPGVYQIKFIVPAGYGFTIPDAAAATDTIDSDAVALTGLAPQTTLVSGENDLSFDAGLVQSDIAIDKKIYLGFYDPDSIAVDSLSAMQGMSITYIFEVINTGSTYLTDIVITDLTLDITDADMTWISGSEPLAPGASIKYYYQSTINGDLVNTAAVIGQPTNAAGNSLPGLAPPEDQNNATRYALSSVGDFVWDDKDGDGTQDPGEPGFAGVKLILTDGDGHTSETLTDVNGYYIFDDLIPDTYSIAIDTATLPAKYHQTFEQDGTLNATTSVTLTDGEIRTDIDFGFCILASIGDTVWLDSNGNGIQDENDQGFHNVEVRLLDSDGGLIDTAYTDADGQYLFDNLTPGTYQIQFIDPVGYGFTVKDTAAATDATDSDADGLTGLAVQTILVSGENDFTFDAGMVQSNINITKQLYSGAYDPDRTPLDSLSAMQGTPVTYIFTVTNTGSNYLSDIVINDLNLAITNADMTLIAGNEPLAPGESIQYYYQAQINGNLVNIASVTANPTDPEGNDLPGLDNPEDQDSATRYALSSIGDYVWEDNDMDGVQDPGEHGYAGVKVTLTDGEDFTQSMLTDVNGYYSFDNLNPGIYTVTIDSTTLPAGYLQTFELDSTLNGQVTVTLEDGDIRTNVDYGYYVLGSIGDLVWKDTNRDGLQQAGEPGLANVRVILLDQNSNPLRETLTDANGKYLFTELVPGIYKISIIKPANMKFTITDAGANDVQDSDAGQDGRTPLKALHSGANDITIDGGLYYIVDLPGISIDVNGIPLAEAIIILIGEDGKEIGRTISDQNGNFEFIDIPGGQSVTIVVKKPGYVDKTMIIQLVDEDIPNTNVILNNIVIPKTGENSNGNWPLATLLLLAVALVYIVRRRKLAAK